MRKKYLLVLTVMAGSCTALFAANFSFSPSKNIVLNSVNCSGVNATQVNIDNTSGAPLSSLMYNVITNTVPSSKCWTATICDNIQCYTNIPEGGTLAPLSAGLNNNIFTLDVNPNNYDGHSIVQIEVYDSNNAVNKDTLTFTINGCSTGASCPYNFEFTPYKEVNLYSTNCAGVNAIQLHINNTSGASLPLKYNVITNTLSDDSCWTSTLCDNVQCYSDIPTDGVLAPLSSGLNNNVFTLDVNPNNYSGNSVLQIEVYDPNNFANKDTVTVNVEGCTTGNACISGISPITAVENRMDIYPNPVKDVLTIKTNNANFFSEKMIGVYNILGEKIISFKLGKSGINKVDVSSFKFGVYFVRYETDKGTMFTQKFYKTTE